MKSLFNFFQENCELSTVKPFDAIFTFYAFQNIAWIISWDIIVSPPNQDQAMTLIRRFKQKWWDGFTVDRFSEESLLQWFRAHPQYWKQGSIIQCQEQSQFLLQKSKIQSQLAGISSPHEYALKLKEVLSQISQSDNGDDDNDLTEEVQSHFANHDPDAFVLGDF
jgi:hypothetical protein